MPYSQVLSLQDNLLTHLRKAEFLSPFHVAVYCLNLTAECPADKYSPCCKSPENAPCAKVCVANLPGMLDKAADAGEAVIVRCPVGLLGFVKKLRQEKSKQCYVVGCGVRERSLDLYRIETVARTEGIDPFTLLEHLQELPVLTEQEVQETADRASRLIDSLTSQFSVRGNIPEAERLKMVSELSRHLDCSVSTREICMILGEATGMMFDVPAIAVAVHDQTGRDFITEAVWGHSVSSGPIRSDQVPKTFSADVASTAVMRRDSLKELFPNTTASSATCHSLVAEGVLLGVIAFLEAEFSAEELLHVELLCGRAALRLARLLQQEEIARKNALASQLLSMISSLAVTDGQELHDQILQMGSELVNATTGSLMILDEEKEMLHIASAIGMSPQLLKVLNIKLGSGIAGKVAMTGHPLLVNDIERDERVAAPNRPRFKTKSFLSLPLVHQGRVCGVLNLSDKKNNEIFTERDLEILTPFVRHVSLMMRRNNDEKKVELLERLSITDPLTELYNRRYLERRMEEEINRSLRTGQNLTVMLIDLDFFKNYNDVCGHVAGDKALKKAATVLHESVREMDVVTRYGGEEFCILLPGTSKRESIFVAERIRRDIENEMFPGEEHLPFGRLTTSIGVSSFPEDGSTSISIINAADIALYEAKKGGRNRIVIYNQTPQSETTAPLAKVTQLKK